MNNKFFDERIVEYTDTDINLNLGIVNMFDYAQDLGTAFFQSIKMDNGTMRKLHNSAWVISKIKLKIFKVPDWQCKIKCENYFTNVGKVKVAIENVFKNENNEIYFIVNQESCLVNFDTKKIRKIEEVNFPTEIKLYERINSDFLKFNDVKKDDMVENSKRQIYLSDLDYSRHTNNTNYIKFILDTFDENSITQISEIDANYIKETKKDEFIDIYKGENGNVINMLIMDGSEEVFKAKIING